MIAETASAIGAPFGNAAPASEAARIQHDVSTRCEKRQAIAAYFSAQQFH